MRGMDALGAAPLSLNTPSLTLAPMDFSTPAPAAAPTPAPAATPPTPSFTPVVQQTRSYATQSDWTQTDVDKVIAETRSMRVDGLPSDIRIAFDRTDEAFRKAQTQAQFNEAMRAGRSAVQQFEAWKKAGSPRESWLSYIIVSPVRVWHVGAAVGGLTVFGGLFALIGGRK